MYSKSVLYLIVILLTTVSCRVDKSIMFRTDEKTKNGTFENEIKDAEESYKIKKYDYLRIAVYTNNGERLIDPNFELRQNKSVSNQETEELNPRYLVRDNGFVRLPMVGNILLEGYTVFQADSIIKEAFSKFYEEVFVITRVVNKRVIVLGHLGGKIISLENEDMNLIEILALYGGLSTPTINSVTGKAKNIKLIRGDLNNPDVQIINLSTIEGMKQATLQVQSNDIIYIEPQKRRLTESIREIASVIAVVGNIITIIFLLSQVN